METDQNHTYKFCMTNTVTKSTFTNMVTLQNFHIMSNKFNVERNGT